MQQGENTGWFWTNFPNGKYHMDTDDDIHQLLNKANDNHGESSNSAHWAFHQSTQYHAVVRTKACEERGGAWSSVWNPLQSIRTSWLQICHQLMQHLYVWCGAIYGILLTFRPLMVHLYSTYADSQSTDGPFVQHLHWQSTDGPFVQHLQWQPTDGPFVQHLHWQSTDGPFVQHLKRPSIN